MSTKLTTWVWHGERTAHLKGNAFVALLALADIANDEGHVIYAKDSKRTQEALAKKARMSVATFRRMTAELVEQGLLEVTRESQRTENEYRVLMSAQVERSDLSGQSAHSYERSERSSGERSSTVTPLIGHLDVEDISLSPDESGDGTLIPPSWRPNQSHIDKAASLHLDVKREYQRFREHAERKRRRLKNWNTGFTNWLRKQAEFAQERQGAVPRGQAPTPTERAHGVLDMAARLQQQADAQRRAVGA